MNNTPALRALIVDDQRFNRTLLRHTLTSLSFTTTEAIDGDEALRMLGQHAFDAVFLDWELPGANKGDHVARTIRAMPQHDRTLLIAITTDTGETMRQRCADAGTDAFLGKSLDAAHVQTALAEAAKKRANSEPHTPAKIISRVSSKLADFAQHFPGGLPAAIESCRAELTLEQQRVQSAMAIAAWADAARAAHNISSLAAMLDLNEIHDAAHATEDALRAGDSGSIKTALAKLNSLLDQTCSALADAKPEQVDRKAGASLSDR